MRHSIECNDSAGGSIVIDHTGINVSNFEASKTFYQKALAPLGYTMTMEFPIDDGHNIEAVCHEA